MSPRGGPDGGDGGSGGNVILVATLGMSTLIDLRHNPRQVAENGGHGTGKQRHGADGGDRIIKVPAGTIVRDQDTLEMLADLTESIKLSLSHVGDRWKGQRPLQEQHLPGTARRRKG